jgi:two-component system, chemotaxis family, CheB/CheR fusion protein
MRSKRARGPRQDSGVGGPIEEIVDALPHGLLLLDGQLRVRRSSPRYCEMLATTMEDIVGRPLFELSNGLWDRSEVRALVENAGSASAPGSVELEREPPAGGPRVLRVRVGRLKAPASDHEPFLVFTVEDATPKAVPTLRDAALDRDELIARAAHELRGPLGSMANWAHLLSQGSKDGALQLQGLAAIHRALKAATQIVDELNDVALLRAGKLRLRAGLVDLLPIVDMALEKPRAAAQEKGVQLEVVREVPSVALMGDPDRLQQILLHLLANAVRHTPAGGRIEIAIGRDETGWRLSVSDTGQGIAREALPRVFEGRTAASPGAARSPAGLGVGLTIVRHLAELHGGSVEASSPGPGLGARFVVRLPVPALAPAGLSPTDGLSALAKDQPLLASSRLPDKAQIKTRQGLIPGV